MPKIQVIKTFVLIGKLLLLFFFLFPFRLAEIGRYASPKVDQKYETGQFFLHKVFGYRGVTLFPWTVKVYDRDLHKKQNQM